VIAALLLFIALNAFAGGVYGMAGAPAVPREWLAGSPFESYRVPSLILIIAVGGSHLAAAAAVLHGSRRARTLTVLAGAILAVWITVQVALIGYVSWLQPAMAVVAVLTMVLSRRLPQATASTALGLERGVVRLVPYDAVWPRLYAEEEARIRAVVDLDLPLALEHVGSTAVPGLAAKPILDLLGGYPPGADVQRYIAALVRAGYTHRGESGIPGREFFRRGEPRAYHLHLAVQGGAFWRDHLAFRDALRASSETRDAYAKVKDELAQRYPRDREAYIEGKTSFVRAVVAQATESHTPRVSP
jgi:GrpB-like predicted nucleotidyltransferase (UPF0157 family)